MFSHFLVSVIGDSGLRRKRLSWRETGKNGMVWEGKKGKTDRRKRGRYGRVLRMDGGRDYKEEQKEIAKDR